MAAKVLNFDKKVKLKLSILKLMRDNVTISKTATEKAQALVQRRERILKLQIILNLISSFVDLRYEIIPIF